MTVFLTAKDDPPYGPHVSTGLAVSLGVWVGTSIETDTGDLSGGSSPPPLGPIKGGIQFHRGAGGIRGGRSGSRISVGVVSTSVDPKSTGRIISDLNVMNSKIHHMAKGQIENSRGALIRRGSEPRGKHIVTRATNNSEGRRSSQ